MRSFFFILIFSFTFHFLAAQEDVSRYYPQLNSENDTLQLMASLVLAENVKEVYPDSAVYYCQKAIELSRHLKLPMEEASALGQMGYALTNLGNYPRALTVILSGIALVEDPASEKHVLPAGFVTPDELSNRKSSPRDQRLDRLAWLYQYLGILYDNANSLEKEKQQYLRAKELAEQTGNLPLLSIINGTLGRVYLYLKNYDSALVIQQTAYDLAVKSGYKKYKGSILLNLARIHSVLGHKKEAIDYLNQAMVASQQQGYLRGVVAGNLELGNIYLQSGNRDSALFYHSSARDIAEQLNSPSLMLRAYRALSSFYNSSNKIDSVVKYQALIIRINDSIFTSKQTQQFQNIDFDAQQRQLEKEAAEKAFQNKLKMYALLVGLAVFLLAAIILWRNNLLKQKAYALLERQKKETDFQKSKVEQTLNELKTAQNQLIQSEKMASLGELTAGIAHEIKNPLNFVNNFSEVNTELTDELTDAIDRGDMETIRQTASDIKSNQQKIREHGQRADAIVKSMLQHSRVSAGQSELTDLNGLVDEYLRLAYHGIRAKEKSFNVRTETDFDPSVGKVKLVPQDIGRVLLNLVNNAIYAVMEKQKTTGEYFEPVVIVSTRRTGGKVEVLVKDNGTGVSTKDLEKIFQPFYTTKPTGEGTGLGLSLSYDIIQAHGGELKVNTEEGLGSEFIIQLPA